MDFPSPTISAIVSRRRRKISIARKKAAETLPQSTRCGGDWRPRCARQSLAAAPRLMNMIATQENGAWLSSVIQQLGSVSQNEVAESTKLRGGEGVAGAHTEGQWLEQGFGL